MNTKIYHFLPCIILITALALQTTCKASNVPFWSEDEISLDTVSLEELNKYNSISTKSKYKEIEEEAFAGHDVIIVHHNPTLRSVQESIQAAQATSLITTTTNLLRPAPHTTGQVKAQAFNNSRKPIYHKTLEQQKAEKQHFAHIQALRLMTVIENSYLLDKKEFERLEKITLSKTKIDIPFNYISPEHRKAVLKDRYGMFS